VTVRGSGAVLLLPPSEGKATGGGKRGRRRVPRTFPELDAARAEVVAALRAAMDDEAGARALLGVKGDALTAARTANRSLAGAPVRPAIERYTGVLYDNLDAASLDPPARKRLDDEVLIVSGLWGLLRPTDPVPDYKLKIDASLPPLGVLRSWWRPHLTPVLDRQAARRVVWDLLPQAHAAVWADADAHAALRITAAFEEERRKGGAVVRAAVTHWSKALKGALARHLLQRPPPAPARDAVLEVLTSFHHDKGYTLDSLCGEGVHLHATFLSRLG
jgi:uncharacterized protein